MGLAAVSPGSSIPVPGGSGPDPVSKYGGVELWAYWDPSAKAFYLTPAHLHRLPEQIGSTAGNAGWIQTDGAQAKLSVSTNDEWENLSLVIAGSPLWRFTVSSPTGLNTTAWLGNVWDWAGAERYEDESFDRPILALSFPKPTFTPSEGDGMAVRVPALPVQRTLFERLGLRRPITPAKRFSG